jgi:uncharacterized protein (TIGR03067 family)
MSRIAKYNWPLGAILLLIVSPLISQEKAQEKKPEVKADRQKLQGTWRIVRIERGEAKIYPRKPKNKNVDMFIEFKDDKVIIERSETETFKLFPNKTPKQIDVIADSGVTFGIYFIHNDDLLICWTGFNDKDRPTEFKTKSGTGHTLLELRRVPPKPAQQ